MLFPLLLPGLALSALLAAPPAQLQEPDEGSPESAPRDQGDSHGKLAWFEGDFVAALEAAEESGQLIFLDFWADW